MSLLGCPSCGSPYAVPKRVIVTSRLRKRWWLFGPIVAVPEVVGNVHLCAKCATEWCAVASGPFVPRAGEAVRHAPGEQNERRHPMEDEPGSMRDADQPWESHRTR